MEALDMLEKRIDTLSRVLGPNESEAIEEITKSDKNLVDSLIYVQGVVDEAIKGRVQITKTLERAPDLEKYLDPEYVDQHRLVKSKEIYLSAVAPEVRNQFEQLEKIKSLEPTLGAEYFRNIPGECTDKLKQILNDNAELAQQSDLIEESLILAMKRYGEIQNGLLQKLDEMKKRLEIVEGKIESKKRTDREKSVE